MLVVHDRLTADLPADVVLLHGGCNYRGPLGDMAVCANTLEEGMEISVWIDGRLDGLLIPLSERGHDASSVCL